MVQKRNMYLWILLILFAEAVWIDGMHQLIFKISCTNRENLITEQNTELLIQKDLRCFPVPLGYRERLYFTDSYGAARGSGVHEGCDIMDRDNLPGDIPVISATDGVITNLGWLYLGGYRIGVTSDNDIYYYYAHLDSYAAGLETGKRVKAGELLGFMGNTGEGEEGTKGRFDTHLHFGIYVKDTTGNERTVNPYPFLLEIDEE